MPRGQPGVSIRQPETRLVSEYIAATYPKARYQLQPRLGTPAPEMQGIPLSYTELRMLGVWRRYADAVVFLSDRVILLEASIKPDPSKISMLDLYAHLFPLTPEFEEFKSLPIEKVVVWGLPDTAAEAVARQHGVRVAVFAPSWVMDYLSTFLERFRRPARITLPSGS